MNKSVRVGKTIEINFDDLHKAQEESAPPGRPGLVKKKVTVKRGGKTFQQYRWVKAGVEEPAEQKLVVEPPVKKPKKELVIAGLNKPKVEPEKSDFASGLKKGMTINFKGEDKKIKFFNPDAKTVTFVGDATNYPFGEVNKYGKEPEGEIEVRKPEPKVEIKIDKKVSKIEMSPNNVESFKYLSDMDIEGGINEDYVSVINFKDGLKGIYKTTSDIDTLGEINFKKIESILGWDNSPELVVDDFGRGEGSCQRWVENIIDHETIKIDNKYFENLSKIYIMDIIVGNYDRHEGNIKLDENGKFWAIDNDTWGSKTKVSLNVKDENMGKQGEWMEIDSNEMDKFQSHINKNIKLMMKHEDKIIKYIKTLSTKSEELNPKFNEKYRGWDMTGSDQPLNIKQATDNILFNISEISKYDKEMGD